MARATKQSLDRWRELARHLSQSATYGINIAPGIADDAGSASERERRLKLAGAALKEIAGQDIGHPAVQAREQARQAPEVIEARAHVLMLDFERYHLQQDLATQGTAIPAAKRRRMAARIAELQRQIKGYSETEVAAYIRVYRSILRKIPKPPKQAPKKPVKAPFTVGAYQPMQVSITEIAMARRNPDVFALERRMADLARLTATGGDRTEYTRTAEAYYRLRDEEVQALRDEQ